MAVIWSRGHSRPLGVRLKGGQARMCHSPARLIEISNLKESYKEPPCNYTHSLTPPPEVGPLYFTPPSLRGGPAPPPPKQGIKDSSSPIDVSKGSCSNNRKVIGSHRKGAQRREESSLSSPEKVPLSPPRQKHAEKPTTTPRKSSHPPSP